MQASLTIIRYPSVFIPFAFLSMAIFRLPLWMNKQVGFFKLFGSGKGGGFNKVPDLNQWAILTVPKTDLGASSEPSIKNILGSFIAGWLKLFHCETWTVIIEPVEGRGSWDGKQIFGELPKNSGIEGPVAIITRATIRLNKVSAFWKHVPAVNTELNQAKGLIASFGIGEVPWIRQVTFSVWETIDDMRSFAYGMKAHSQAVRDTRAGNWFREELFVRFKIVAANGTLKGKDPLKGKLYI